MEEGIIVSREAQIERVSAAFIQAIAQHRHWKRELKHQVPA